MRQPGRGRWGDRGRPPAVRRDRKVRASIKISTGFPPARPPPGGGTGAVGGDLAASRVQLALTDDPQEELLERGRRDGRP